MNNELQKDDVVKKEILIVDGKPTEVIVKEIIKIEDYTFRFCELIPPRLPKLPPSNSKI